MKKIILLITLLHSSLIVFNACQKKISPIEELRIIGDKMSRIEHVLYDYQLKTYQSYIGDTTSGNGSMYFIKNPTDTAIGMNFYHKSLYGDIFYNGDFEISMLSLDSTANKFPLDDYDSKSRSMSVLPSLELSFCAIKLFLTDSTFYSSIDSLHKSDTTINKNKCDLYCFWTDEKAISTHKHYEHPVKIYLGINKKKKIPVYYSRFYQLKNNRYVKNYSYVYEQAVFSNYNFKTEYPDSMFSIEHVPSYYRWDRFKKYAKLLENVPAPDWSLPDLDGNTISLSSLRGSVVLLDFWFIGCGPCLKTIPILNKLQEKYENDNFIILGVNCYSKKPEKIREWCMNNDMRYKNVWGGDELFETYSVKGAPIFYLIDKTGNIVYSQMGEDNKKLEESVSAFMTY